jgi:hypothetical protein
MTKTSKRTVTTTAASDLPPRSAELAKFLDFFRRDHVRFASLPDALTAISVLLDRTIDDLRAEGNPLRPTVAAAEAVSTLLNQLSEEALERLQRVREAIAADDTGEPGSHQKH